MNISSSLNKQTQGKPAYLLRTLGQPMRLEILLAIGTGEACVCHLEACLGQRQALISQHLMALRNAGLVITHRQGRNIFYCLKSPTILDLVKLVSRLAGVPESEIVFGTPTTVLPNCSCPHCRPDEECKCIGRR